MTTDPFTEAARAEAERYFADPGIDPLALSVIDHAMHMAEWARTHLAAQEGHRRVRKYADDWDTCACGHDAWPCRSQEPTDAEVEAACAGFYNDPSGLTDWTRLASADQELADKYRAGMRRALSAARAARRDEEKRDG